ncbi:hypothetical protein R3P38DRAFT_3183526 [Favolaschia claudopus]|uniref:Uncharacterized protein n=1 Tax=Favolaschia claudopus TaxID=2862362 RepID=A0AAW0CAH2_9AGAR
MPDSNPKSSQRPASLFIDDSAEERSKVDHTERFFFFAFFGFRFLHYDTFINDASDLSVYSKDDNNMDITVTMTVTYSSLSQDERDEDRPMVDATAHSDEEVIVVETPSRVKQSPEASSQGPQLGGRGFQSSVFTVYTICFYPRFRAVLVLPNAKQGSRKLANVGLGNGAQKAEGQPKIFLRVQKSRDTEVKSAELYVDAAASPKTEVMCFIRCACPTFDVDRPLYLRPPAKPTNKVIPVQPEDPVDVPGVIDDHMDVTVNNEMQVAQSVSPSSVAKVEGITVAPLPNPTQAVVLDNSASKALVQELSNGLIRSPRPVESKATFDSRPFSRACLSLLTQCYRAVVSPTTRVAVRQYLMQVIPLPFKVASRCLPRNRPDRLPSMSKAVRPIKSSPARITWLACSLRTAWIVATRSRRPDVCEVSDDKLQDEANKDVYKGLCKLPGGRKLLPSFVRSQSGEDWSPGGRLAFSYWFKALNEFRASGDTLHPNGSPDRVLLAQEPGTSPYAYKLYIGNEYAGRCDSRTLLRKLCGRALPLERFAPSLSEVPIRSVPQPGLGALRVLHFSTKMNTVEAVKQTSMLDRLNKYMDSPKQSGSSGRRPSPTNKFSLEYTDDGPVYDARHLDFDFTADLPKMRLIASVASQRDSRGFIRHCRLHRVHLQRNGERTYG